MSTQELGSVFRKWAAPTVSSQGIKKKKLVLLKACFVTAAEQRTKGEAKRNKRTRGLVPCIALLFVLSTRSKQELCEPIK